jgi:predicted  nucleic acid-binding Zn-ribbon protein
VRKEVLAATGGKQVPWDHSALTGDFYFQQASAGGALPKVFPGRPATEEAMQQRLRQLEEELKKKSDPQLTAKVVSLSQAKARLQQLEDGNRQDQQRIFDTYRKAGAASDPAARNAINREVGSIQMDMARRSQEMRNLRAQIGTLEGELGLTAAK